MQTNGMDGHGDTRVSDSLAIRVKTEGDGSGVGEGGLCSFWVSVEREGLAVMSATNDLTEGSEVDKRRITQRANIIHASGDL